MATGHTHTHTAQVETEIEMKTFAFFLLLFFRNSPHSNVARLNNYFPVDRAHCVPPLYNGLLPLFFPHTHTIIFTFDVAARHKYKNTALAKLLVNVKFIHIYAITLSLHFIIYNNKTRESTIFFLLFIEGCRLLTNYRAYTRALYDYKNAHIYA